MALHEGMDRGGGIPGAEIRCDPRGVAVAAADLCERREWELCVGQHRGRGRIVVYGEQRGIAGYQRLWRCCAHDECQHSVRVVRDLLQLEIILYTLRETQLRGRAGQKICAVERELWPGEPSTANEIERIDDLSGR